MMRLLQRLKRSCGFWCLFALRKAPTMLFTAGAGYAAMAGWLEKLLGPKAWPVWVAWLVVVCAVCSILWDGLVEWRHERDKRRVAAFESSRSDIVRWVLRSYVDAVALIKPAAVVRANVMVMEGRQLRIAHHYGMEHDRDRAITFAARQGCCGLAWAEKLPRVADYTTGDEKLYRLTAAQRGLVNPDRQWFLSIPILSRDAAQAIAVVNLDSDVPLVEADREDAKKALIAVGVANATVLRPLLRPEEASS